MSCKVTAKMSTTTIPARTINAAFQKFRVIVRDLSIDSNFLKTGASQRAINTKADNELYMINAFMPIVF